MELKTIYTESFFQCIKRKENKWIIIRRVVHKVQVFVSVFDKTLTKGISNMSTKPHNPKISNCKKLLNGRIALNTHSIANQTKLQTKFLFIQTLIIENVNDDRKCS